ncbi:MAG TPA: hypothetical protein VF734_19040 [Pseudonocardiaceae bacterium]
MLHRPSDTPVQCHAHDYNDPGKPAIAWDDKQAREALVSALVSDATTITDPRTAPAQALAYQQRWEHETGNDQLKTHLRGPGKVLRSKSPDMVRQEIYGYLLTHYAISTLICQAATEADIDPDTVKFTRTVRILRRTVGPAAFPP